MKSLVVTDVWTPVTVGGPTIFQASGGPIHIETEDTTSEREGIVLKNGESIKLYTGNLYYKKSGYRNAVLKRMEVSE